MYRPANAQQSADLSARLGRTLRRHYVYMAETAPCMVVLFCCAMAFLASVVWFVAAIFGPK